ILRRGAAERRRHDPDGALQGLTPRGCALFSPRRPFILNRAAPCPRIRSIMQVSDVYLVLLVKSVTTLLPLVPAYVLFKALRSHARGSGPVKGLTVQLGGPFAAYFIVFFILWKGFDVEVERFHYHTWRVNGSVAFLEGGESVNNSDINCYIRPPELHVQKD